MYTNNILYGENPLTIKDKLIRLFINKNKKVSTRKLIEDNFTTFNVHLIKYKGNWIVGNKYYKTTKSIYDVLSYLNQRSERPTKFNIQITVENNYGTFDSDVLPQIIKKSFKKLNLTTIIHKYDDDYIVAYTNHKKC